MAKADISNLEVGDVYDGEAQVVGHTLDHVKLRAYGVSALTVPLEDWLLDHDGGTVGLRGTVARVGSRGALKQLTLADVELYPLDDA